MRLHLMPIELGARWYLVEARLVHEVLGAEPWLPIPRARAELPGIVVWRGRAVPLVDLALMLGTGAEPANQRARTLIVRHEQGAAAFAVDGAREVRTVTEDRLRAIPHQALPYSRRELDDDGTSLPLIELDALLSELDQASQAGDHAGI
jgi:chemotaxis signal transduction protein